jgi:hypothetical protein
MIAGRIAMLLRILCGIIEIIMFGMIVGRMLAKLVSKRSNYGKNGRVQNMRDTHQQLLPCVAGTTAATYGSRAKTAAVYNSSAGTASVIRPIKM